MISEDAIINMWCSSKNVHFPIFHDYFRTYRALFSVRRTLNGASDRA